MPTNTVYAHIVATPSQKRYKLNHQIQVGITIFSTLQQLNRLMSNIQKHTCKCTLLKKKGGHFGVERFGINCSVPKLESLAVLKPSTESLGKKLRIQVAKTRQNCQYHQEEDMRCGPWFASLLELQVEILWFSTKKTGMKVYFML